MTDQEIIQVLTRRIAELEVNRCDIRDRIRTWRENNDHSDLAKQKLINEISGIVK